MSSARRFWQPTIHKRDIAAPVAPDEGGDWVNLLSRVQEIPLQIAPEAHLINLDRPHEVPGEEFRSLRTRLNHVQGQQNIHSLIVTSASPAEGKTFTAVNLALAQAQLAENPVLLADLDLRRPIIHHLFQSERGPGFSDYLIHGAPLESVIRRVGNTNLYLMPAGTAVKNPLELLNLRQVRTLLTNLPRVFNWVIADTPPLLFSADANLLATLMRRHIDRCENRLDHVRQHRPGDAVAVRKQRDRHRGQRRARHRTVQQVHLLLFEARLIFARHARSHDKNDEPKSSRSPRHCFQLQDRRS